MKQSVHEAVPDQQIQLPTRDLLALWWRRHTTRHQLRHALQSDPERLYADLGLSENELRQESVKWFWES